MARIRLKYVDAFVDRHGLVRYYFRRSKGPRTALPGAPGSDAFMAAYRTALGAPERPGKPDGADRTLHALVTLYLGSGSFANLADITRANYRRALDRFRETHGKLSVAGFEARHAAILIDALAPNAGYALWRVLRLLFKFAFAQKWRPDDPMAGVHAPRRPKTDGYRTATQDDVQTFRDHYPLGTKPRLAFELLYNTAVRRADAVRLGRQHVSRGFLTYTQGKTGTELTIEVNAELQAAFDADPKTQLTFLVTEYGAPFTPQGFTNWFKDKCKAAGLPANTSPHSLRKGLLTHLANNGATTRQLMAVSGHKTLAEVERYTRKADQKRLASAALSTISEHPTPTRNVGLGKRAKKASNIKR